MSNLFKIKFKQSWLFKFLSSHLWGLIQIFNKNENKV